MASNSRIDILTPIDLPIVTRNRRPSTSYSSKYEFLPRILAFLIFTILSITASTLTVYYTSQKKLNTTCYLIFETSAQRSMGSDSSPRYAAVGDFNKDGLLDIAVANSGTDSIGIFIGYGNGTFANQISYSTGLRSRPYSLAVGNFNNGTQLDIVVANFGINSVGVLLGYRNGSFANPVITSLGSSRPLSLTTGYINKDNYLDIAVANYGTSTITILLGSNDGSFKIDTIHDMGYDSIPYSLIVADLNNDSKVDIAVVNYGTSNLAILLANNNGSFSIYKYSTGKNSHPTSVTTGDFNNDKIMDIAVTNSDTSNIGVFQGNGDGTFRNMVIQYTDINFQPQFIVASNFIESTELDLLVIDSESSNVIVLGGFGNGSFQAFTIYSTGYQSNPSSIALGDFNNDNKPDVAITNNATNNLLVLAAYSIAPITEPTIYPTGTNSKPLSVAVGDLNNDNFSDIVEVNTDSNTIGIFMNLGNGTFGNKREIFIANDSGVCFVTVIDVNKDHNLDIIIAVNGLSAISIYLGYGNGSFNDGDGYSTGDNSNPQSIAAADLNNDSNIDLVVASYTMATIGILFGNGNGTFRVGGTYLSEIAFLPTSILLNDINNDTKLDIITADQTNGGIAILQGYGNGTFSNPLILSTNADTPTSLAIGDLNNDHRLDIIYVSYTLSTLAIIWGYGNGTFGNTTKCATERGSWPLSVAVGDLNQDTLLDIVITNAYSFNIGIFFGLGNQSFAPQKTFSTGYNSFPCSIAIYDFNNDGKLDIVVSNRDTNTIAVFIMYYQLGFTQETSYFTGSGPHPYSVAIYDFNKDNQSEIVVANPGNDNIQVLIGYDQGSFITKLTYSVGFGSYPQFVNVADFNRDNQLDIIVANNRNDTVNVFFGSQNGTFDGPTIHSTGSGSFPCSIAIGDFNKDNWTDIVVANNGTNNIGVFLGFDYATFTNDTIYIPGPSPQPFSIAVDDFNNDFEWDFAVTNFGVDTVGVYLGYGNGTFAGQRSFSTGAEPYSIATGDFNNDNRSDIVVVNLNENSISVLLGYGNGSFQTQKKYSTGPSSYPISIAVGDINNDNNLDIVVANLNGQNIGIFIGYGNGIFKQQIPYFIYDVSSPISVTVDDLNNDNMLDIIVSNSGGDNVGIFFGYGNGSFKDMKALATGINSLPYYLAIGDLNNDNWTDIAVSNDKTKTIGIFFGYGNDTFSPQTRYPIDPQASLSSIIVGDLNNDTKLDIAFTDFGNGNGNLGVLYGYGDGNFTMLKTYSTGLNSDPTSVAICDFNNDNRSDLAIAYYNKDSIGIMLRQKSEPFATSILFPTDDNSHPKSVAVGDFNHDNNLDIVVANSGTNNIDILLGDGSGNFSLEQIYSTGDNSNPSSIAVGDFNSDNHLDIVVANSQADNIIIFYGYGNGTVALLRIYSTGVGSIPSSIVVRNLNADGYLDIIVGNYGSNDVLVFYGFNNGTFLEPKSYTLGYNSRPQSVAIGDINNDNFLDIVVANSGTDYVEILLQKCLPFNN